VNLSRLAITYEHFEVRRVRHRLVSDFFYVVLDAVEPVMEVRER